MTNKLKRQLMELIAFAGLITWLIINYKLLFLFINTVIKLLMPLIIGIAIAFIINVPMKQIEKNIFKIDKRKHKKLIRIISLLISIILIFGILGLILFLIIPEFIEAIGSIIKIIPENMNWLRNILDKISNHYPFAKELINKIDYKNLFGMTIGTTSALFSAAITFLSGMVSRVIMVFIGFIISIYILIDKERLATQIKKILHAFLSNKVVSKIINIVKLSNKSFTKFITGQCLDACLTGFEFFIILSILKIPYALILGVLFAITALIPYIGAFITLVVGAILIYVTNPIKALWYIVSFFILQQFDDNFTYPKIVGKSVGLPPLCALVAVLIGGSLLGFIGMLISIPIASIIYTLLKEYVSERLEKKNLIDKK